MVGSAILVEPPRSVPKDIERMAVLKVLADGRRDLNIENKATSIEIISSVLFESKRIKMALWKENVG